MFEECSVNGKFAQSGLKNGTDKMEMHRYYHYYPQYVERYRNIKNFAMLEIGILFYSSINTWLEYLPECYVYGTDIVPKESYGKFKSLICDQSNINHLENVVKSVDSEHKVYFILDDGIHIPEYQIFSFNYLFEHLLQPGGCFIIEDIETSYWKRGQLLDYVPNYGYRHKNSAIEKFKNLVEEVNYLYLSDDAKVEQNILTKDFSENVKKMISSISFGQNCIIVMKKTEEEMTRNRDDYFYKTNL
uniref:Methyltransferase n=1 Tax=viral metagenome TaxID=1070528 RepID=A0A6C0AFJ3_9ZZZZ